jgi:DNA topoisomerase-1
MRLAQKLYEGIDINGESTGLITYMRTDGTQLAGEAVSAIRFAIQKKYGDQYLPKSPNVYKSKVKNAQEAHEAIRPTDITRTPESLKGVLDDAHLKLYTLIWKRTLACQMSQAIFDQLTAVIENDDKNHAFKATGTTLVFDGFLAVYQEGKDDEEKDDETVLPPLEVSEKLAVQDILPKQHFTEPPARYSEASLVKKLEELGIGRPSTYATILQVLQDRAYVKLERRYFTPEVRGRLVTSFLKNYFSRYVEYDFTAKLEDQLDDISSGELKWLEVIKKFWDPFDENVAGALQLDITKVIETIENELSLFLFQGEGPEHKCPKCSKGDIHLRLGKYGAFLGCTLYPDCDYTRQLTTESINQDNTPVDDSTISLGRDPNTGSEVTLRKGPYGFYLQWEGEVEEPLPSKTKRKKTAAPKPKRVGLPSGTAPASVTLDQALALKQIPKFLGNHPDTDEPLILGLGRFGPYVKHKDLFASIPKSIPYLEISLEKAVELVNAKALKVTKKKEAVE